LQYGKLAQTLYVNFSVFFSEILTFLTGSIMHNSNRNLSPLDTCKTSFYTHAKIERRQNMAVQFSTNLATSVDY